MAETNDKNVPRACGSSRWAVARCWGWWEPSTKEKNGINVKKRTARMREVAVGDGRMLGVVGTINEGKKN